MGSRVPVWPAFWAWNSRRARCRAWLLERPLGLSSSSTPLTGRPRRRRAISGSRPRRRCPSRRSRHPDRKRGRGRSAPGFFGLYNNNGEVIVNAEYNRINEHSKNLFQLVKGQTIVYYDVSKSKFISLKN